MALLDSAQSYTFSKYFELRFESGELAEEFGYTSRRQNIQFDSLKLNNETNLD